MTDQIIDDARMLLGRTYVEPTDTIASMPNIIFNSAPKSGSVYISKALQDGLGYSFMYISPGYVPHDNITYDWIKKFFQDGGSITQEHLDASIFNTQLLKKFTDRAVVHIRDPRAILLSWTLHMNEHHRNGFDDFLYYVAPTPPQEYYAWALEQQLDWQIDNFLPTLVTWLNEWLEFQKLEQQNPNGFKVLITTYDEFHADEMAFYHKVLDFYDIPRNAFTLMPANETALHRSTSHMIDDWRPEFTDAQLQRIDAMVPPCLLQQFGWEATIVNAQPILASYMQKGLQQAMEEVECVLHRLDSLRP